MMQAPPAAGPAAAEPSSLASATSSEVRKLEQAIVSLVSRWELGHGNQKSFESLVLKPRRDDQSPTKTVFDAIFSEESQLLMKIRPDFRVYEAFSMNI